MATKTIVSDQSKTPVGSQKTELYTRTRITYSLDQNGKVDSNSIKQEILYQQVPGDPPVIAATRTGATGDFTFTKNSFTGETYFGADAQKSLKEGALKTTTQQQINTASKKEGLTPEQTKAVSGSSNAATSTETGDPITNEDRKFFEGERESIEKNQRQKYDDVIYPEGLKLEYQDCIKFSIVKYQQSGLRPFGSQDPNLRRVILENGVPLIKERQRLATIVLPIPGGIQDSNQVVWSSSELNDIQQAFGNLAQTGIMGGNFAEEAKKSAEAATKPGSGVRTAFISKLTESAIGQGNLMQRQFGTIINPNLELLFNSPGLRQFSFSFKLSPRSKTEAEIVRKIIRNFKQAMSVKRSTSSFLLQTPHTFAISYIFKNKDHPYLNKFKECALTNCNVNYTPEATYMSFEDGAMVSYQLDLTFQELEPIYDDDYGSGYTNIGY
jgi:hypothetical protein